MCVTEEETVESIEVFPELESLSDPELKDLIERKVEEERNTSMQRRIVHGQLDLLRQERVERLKDRYGEDFDVPGDDG
jgi:hypothetical protein